MGSGHWRAAAYLTATTGLYALPLMLHMLWDVGLRARFDHDLHRQSEPAARTQYVAKRSARTSCRDKA